MAGDRPDHGKLVLDFTRAPGDVTMMTALVRDIRLTHGDRFRIDVRTKFPALWRHNPYLTPLDSKGRDVRVLRLGGNRDDAADRQAVRATQSGLRRHYVTAFHRAFEARTGVHVPVTKPHGDLHLSDEERSQPLVSPPYWIVVPGGKVDMTTKWWPLSRYQRAVDLLRERGLRFVQEGANKPLHVHPPLRDVLNLVGRTSIRDMIVNIHHCDGVICGCTFQMHLAAALGKPCVVLLGGREEPWFEAYDNEWDAFGPVAGPVRTPHRVLHTFGAMACCRERGCWLRRTTRLNDGMKSGKLLYDTSLCVAPVPDGDNGLAPECLVRFSAEDVADAAWSYYLDGVIPMPRREVGADDLVGAAVPPEMPPLPHFLREPEQSATKPLPTARPPAVARPTPAAPPASPPAAASVPPTVLLVLFGDNRQAHRRCLHSLLETPRRDMPDLRVLCNQVCDETLRMVERSADVSHVSVDRGRRRKFDALREALNDPARPILSPWVVCLDDCAFIRQRQWLSRLSAVIDTLPAGERVGMLGEKLSHQLRATTGDPRRWFRDGGWWRDRPLRNRRGVEAPNGDQIVYCRPNVLALSMAAVRECQIPDPRASQSGGGIVIAEQLHQHGWTIREFDAGRTLVGVAEHGTKNRYPWT